MRRLSPIHRLRVAWLGFTSPHVPLSRKLLVGILALAYLIVPIDLVPEAVLPIIGYVDDLFIVPLLLSLVAGLRSRHERKKPAAEKGELPA